MKTLEEVRKQPDPSDMVQRSRELHAELAGMMEAARTSAEKQDSRPDFLVSMEHPERGTVRTHRAEHASEHWGPPRRKKPDHGVFSSDFRDYRFLDGLFKRPRSPLTRDDGRIENLIYMERPVGTQGEAHVKMVLENDGISFITAFPAHY